MHTETEARRLTDEEIEARMTVPDPSRLGPGAPGGFGAPPAVAEPSPPPAPRSTHPPYPAEPSSSATTQANSCPMKASS